MVISQSGWIRQQSRFLSCCAEHAVILNTINITIATHVCMPTTY